MKIVEIVCAKKTVKIFKVSNFHNFRITNGTVIIILSKDGIRLLTKLHLSSSTFGSSLTSKENLLPRRAFLNDSNDKSVLFLSFITNYANKNYQEDKFLITKLMTDEAFIELLKKNDFSTA